MLFPILGFVLGVFLLVVTILIYQGKLFFKSLHLIEKLKSSLLFLGGNSLIALAAILGLAGYWNLFNGSDLKLARIILLLVGLSITSWSLLEVVEDDSPLGKLKNLASPERLAIFLAGISVITLFSLFSVAFFDGDGGGDAFMYHIPFAARMWGIIPPEQYTFEFFTENRYLGFPLAAHWFQGLFWTIFRKPEATNLTAYFSLIVLIIYLKNYLKLPFYLTVLPLLAVPMIHMHATRSYVDLFGNVLVAILILTLYLLYSHKKQLDRVSLAIMFVSATGAANSKHLLAPVIGFILIFVIYQLFKVYYFQIKNPRQKRINLAKMTLIGSFACLLIFGTQVKNTLLYQNPFYPVEISIMGHVLNHTEPQSNYMNPELRKLLPPVRWLKSALEIDAFDNRRPTTWTLAMDFVSLDDAKYGVGGYFGGYFVFNVILFVYLCWKHKTQETKVAIALVSIMTLMTWALPQSYELRFYMYWMIVFVSLNSYLLCEYNNLHKHSIIKPQYFGLIALVFMIIFIDKTAKSFTVPQFHSLTYKIENAGWIDPKTMKQFKDGDKICLVNKSPFAFLYNSYFHPPQQYFLKSEFLVSEEFVKEKCGKLKIVK
jgi:hypothetical protein